MYTLLALTALWGWTYEGFCSDPGGDAPVVKVIVVPKVSPDSAPSPPPGRPAPAVAPPAEPPPIAIEPRLPAPPAVKLWYPPAQPTLWRLADASGQVWEHTNAEWLTRWVASRNQALKRPPARIFRPVVPPATYTTNCANGRCYRNR